MDEDEQQQHKPTTDGTQVASHSCSLWSRVKRALYFDDDSSGSQPQQPPLKRQTSLRAQQECNSVGINSNGPNPINANTVDEYAAAEIALQNELVLESLFRVMNRSDLLSCRVVNKQWQYEATKELRRRKLVIRFSFQSQANKVRQDEVFREICRRLSECRTPSLLSSLQVKTDAFNELGSVGVTNFFTTVGNELKHLTLHLNYSRKTSFFERSFLVTALENLLFRQASNLEFLEIKFDFPLHWEAELETLDAFGQNQTDHNECRLLPNLKTFIASGSPAPKVLADIVNAAVNLRSLGGVWSASSNIRLFTTDASSMLSMEEFWSACIRYFLGAEGRDKLRLLKKLSFQLTEHSQIQWNQLDAELMETFLTEHKQNLQLETFECVSKFFDCDTFFTPRIVGVVNQILKCSSGSLQKLRIEPAKWFNDLLVIPCLPKLHEICFDCSRVMLFRGGFFPRGFKMNSSFPNVTTIVLLRCSASLFFSRVEIEMAEPVQSIRYIILKDSGRDDNIGTPLATVTDFRNVFPNLVSISYVDSEKYYKI